MIKQSLTLTYNGKKLIEGTDYTVSYSNNKKVGTASVTIKGKGDYTGSVSKTFKIAIAIKNAKGKLNCKKLSGSKNLKVTSKGKIVVKKGTKKGAYKIKVKITAKGNSSYKPKSVTKTVKIKVK